MWNSRKATGLPYVESVQQRPMLRSGFRQVMAISASPLAVDIETVGLDWDELVPDVQEYLLNRARSDEERDEVPQRLALHPATGRIIAIGLWRPHENRGGVLVEGEKSAWQPLEDDDAVIYRGSEAEILQAFWQMIQDGAGRIITYNGRAFDGPFLMLRSIMLGVTPTRNLVPYRYSFEHHCDLAEVLTFYGVRRRDALAFWCHQTGIASSKGDLDGAGVAAAYAAGELDRIARYCLGDARVTAELYTLFEPLVDLMDRRS